MTYLEKLTQAYRPFRRAIGQDYADGTLQREFLQRLPACLSLIKADSGEEEGDLLLVFGTGNPAAALAVRFGALAASVDVVLDVTSRFEGPEIVLPVNFAYCRPVECRKLGLAEGRHLYRCDCASSGRKALYEEMLRVIEELTSSSMSVDYLAPHKCRLTLGSRTVASENWKDRYARKARLRTRVLDLNQISL